MKEERYTEGYWSSELSRAKDEHAKYLENAEESIKVYSGEHKLPDCDRRINIWWSLTQTLLPAYFSRAPKIEADLRKKVGGDIERVSAIAVERGTQYALDEENDTEAVCLDAVTQFQLTGRAVIWNRYDAAVEPEVYEYGLLRNEKGELYTEDGKAYEGDQALIEEKDGILSVREEIPSKKSEKALIESINYRDYLVSCARNESEVEWKARRAFLSEERAREKFGKEIASQLSYDSYPEDIKKGRRQDSYGMQGKAELHEIWCIESNKVYWLSQGKKSLLESGDPPINYRGFWPCSELCANLTPNSVIPIGDYFLCRDLIIEVERLTTRIHATVQACRSNAAYDATIGAEIESLLTGDLKMLPIKNWPTHKTQRGGLQNMVEFLPIDNYIRALEILINARESALNKLYEITAASDLIRGATAPTETATAQQLKSNFTNLRFSVRQRHVYEFLNEAVVRLAETVCEQYSPDKLYQICHGDQLVAQLPQDPNMPMDPMMQWAMITDLLKEDPRRRYKIEIATDSIVALDERADRQERVDLLQSVGSFLGQLEPIIQAHPSTYPMAAELLKFTVRSYRVGKEMEGVFNNWLGAVNQEIQQKQAEGPPPDPATIDSQTRLQIAQIESQMEQAKMQAQLQETGQKAEIEQYRLNLDMQMEQQRAALEIEKTKLEFMRHEMESNLKAQELNLRAQEIAASTDQKAADSMLDARSKEFQALIDQQKMELEKYRVQLETYEKLVEERRLSQSQGTQISISKDGAHTKKRRGKIIRDEQGNSTIEIDEELVPFNGAV